MTGVYVIFAGLAFVVAGLSWLLGPVCLLAAGGLMVVVGLFVDFDRRKEPQRGKRHPKAP